MGCSPSSPLDVAGGNLVLQNAKLRFSSRQLRGLSARLSRLRDENSPEPISDEVETIAERLVQGIVNGAAAKDPRFASKYLVVLHNERMIKSQSLEYLVLLDGLQGNCSVAEGPPGCMRLRPTPDHEPLWQEFLTPSGFLRRDKVVERWVEVLAAAAGGGEEDSPRAPCPGLLVPPSVLHRLHGIKAEEQCYYGDVSGDKSQPRPRDYRIAIVEGSPWVRVRMAGGRLGAHGAEAKLALGVPFGGWPAGSDFPARAPLGHPDALLFYRAAQTGFLVVAGPPPPGAQWSERAAGWQVWAAGARALLSSRGSGPAGVARAAGAVLQHLREVGQLVMFVWDSSTLLLPILSSVSKQSDNEEVDNPQPPLRAVSRFMVEEALLWRTEQPVGRGLAGDLRAWSAPHLAHHVICIIDSILGEIRERSGRHYFFPGCDVIKMSVWRGARIGERDWRGDADCLMNFLKKLHEESLNSADGGLDSALSQERLEGALCCRWGLVLQEQMPAGSTRGRRLAGAPLYSPRQLAYVAAASRDLLAARQCVIQESNEWFQGGLSTTVHQLHDPIEDLIHLLAVILDQARDYFIKSSSSEGVLNKPPLKDYSTEQSPKHKISSKDTLKRHKLRNCYDASAAYLIDAVRRDPETQKEDLTDDAILVRTLLKWLYRAVDDDKKYLSPVLKPYLELLFMTSHENCWHLDEFKTRVCEKELNGLTNFCKMVHSGEISPADGVVDAAAKGWHWADGILEMLETMSTVDVALRLVFPLSDGRSLKFDLSLPSEARERDKWTNFHATKKDRLTAKLRMAEQCVLEAFDCGLDSDVYGFEASAHYSKSEESIHTVKYNGDASKTHTLRSTGTVKSHTGTIDTMKSYGTIDTVGSGGGYSYYTTRSAGSKYNTLKNSEILFGSYWSSGDTVRMKQGIQKPVVYGETCSGPDDTAYGSGDENEPCMHCALRDSSPMQLALEPQGRLAPHREYAGIIKALINMQRYSVLQELAGWVPGREERAGALRALHRLARGGGRRASGPSEPGTQPPAFHTNTYTLSPKRTGLNKKCRASIRQYYRRRNIDAMSGDESKKTENKTEESQVKSESPSPSPISREDQLDLEIQQEYLKNKSTHTLFNPSGGLDDHYLDLCKEAIRDSNVKRSNAAFIEFHKDMKNKMKVASRSSTLGRMSGMEAKNILEASMESCLNSSTLGRGTGRDRKSGNGHTLLGTCREARLNHAARRSILPRAVSAGDGIFGDAFKVSPIYAAVQSEYETMTQSILQGAVSQPALDRQRQLAPPRDKQYP